MTMGAADVEIEELRAALEPLLAAPGKSAVLMDFDGTLAPIVDVPEDAMPLPDAPAMLGQLAGRYACVGVVSGRPLSFLRRFFPAGVLLAGQYGLERLANEELTELEQVGAWREVIDDVASTLAARVPAGLRVEHKGYSITVHYREHPELEDDARRAAAEQARRAGLEVRDARCSIELHPPIDVDKGTVVRSMARSLRAVCFVGDDDGDLSAFDALDDLALDGVATLRVAVRSAEASDELLDRADVIVADPRDVLRLLGVLLDVDAA
jgi:trehalose 6-phosphate phosphatase